MKKFIFSTLFVSSLMLLSSCMGEGEGNNTGMGEGLFTVEKSGSNYILYRDYGGVIHPVVKDVNEMTEGKGFKDGDRVYLMYQYNVNNILQQTGKGSYITDVSLIQGQMMQRISLLSRNLAEENHQLDSDSIFTSPSITYVGAYRGFLSIRYNATVPVVKFCEKCKTSYADEDAECKNDACAKNKLTSVYIVPTYNAVYELTDENPNRLRLSMYYNQHTDKKTQKRTELRSIFATYPLSELKVTSDSIVIDLSVYGKTETTKLKIGREDLTPGNYLYFQ